MLKGCPYLAGQISILCASTKPPGTSLFPFAAAVQPITCPALGFPAAPSREAWRLARKSTCKRAPAPRKASITQEELMGARGAGTRRPPGVGAFYLKGTGPWRLGKRRGIPVSGRLCRIRCPELRYLGDSAAYPDQTLLGRASLLETDLSRLPLLLRKFGEKSRGLFPPWQGEPHPPLTPSPRTAHWHRVFAPRRGAGGTRSAPATLGSRLGARVDAEGGWRPRPGELSPAPGA